MDEQERVALLGLPISAIAEIKLGVRSKINIPQEAFSACVCGRRLRFCREIKNFLSLS